MGPQQSAQVQIVDLQTGKEAATQVRALLLSASLSTAVNAVKGLTREEMVECLVSPLREPSDFLASFDAFAQLAWYLHHTPEGRWYFDRQENPIKLLQSLAHDAPDNQVDDLIRHRLRDMFKPARKTCCEHDFNATILGLFDKVLFPIQHAGRPARLASKPFNGEEQVGKTLTSNPLNLYLDVERELDAVRDKARNLLWPENQDEARWSDAIDRYAEQPGMPWCRPRAWTP